MIQDGKKVRFHYTLTVDGKLLEKSAAADPLEYVHGKGMIIPGLEKGLEGLKEGEKKKIHVHSEEAYGPIRPEALIEVPKDKVPPGAKSGSRLTAESEEGETLHGVIRDVRPETVLIDFNHPLAGKDLIFEVEIVSVLLEL